MRTIVVALALAVISSATACTVGGDPATGTESSASLAASADSFCDTFCQKLSECDSSNDLQTCTGTCEQDVGRTIAKARADVMAETAACWQGSDCRQVLSDGRLGDCIEEASVSIAPNATAKALCNDLGVSLLKCDAKLDRASCLEAAKVYSDPTLEQAKKCASKSCSVIMDCLNATL